MARTFVILNPNSGKGRGKRLEPRIRQAGGLFRVYVGPYPEREEARRTGERLREEFGFTTTVAPH